MPECKLIFLTMAQDPDLAAEAFRPGRDGVPGQDLGAAALALRCDAAPRRAERWRPPRPRPRAGYCLLLAGAAFGVAASSIWLAVTMTLPRSWPTLTEPHGI